MKRAVGVLLLLSCGGVGQGEPTPIPLDRMPAALKKALCDKVYSCCSASERMANPLIGTDPASCQASLGAYATFLLADIQGSVTGKRVIYHGDQMASCLAEIHDRSCDQVKMPADRLDVTSLCDGVLEPQVRQGAGCSDSWDCIDGWCAGDAGGLKDTCVLRKADGANCDEDDECTSDACTFPTCGPPAPGSGNICKIGMSTTGH